MLVWVRSSKLFTGQAQSASSGCAEYERAHVSVCQRRRRPTRIFAAESQWSQMHAWSILMAAHEQSVLPSLMLRDLTIPQIRMVDQQRLASQRLAPKPAQTRTSSRDHVSELGTSSVKNPPIIAADTIQIEERPGSAEDQSAHRQVPPEKIFTIHTNRGKDCNLRAATLLQRVESRNLDADKPVGWLFYILQSTHIKLSKVKDQSYHDPWVKSSMGWAAEQ